jgi:hypothetical protein
MVTQNFQYMTRIIPLSFVYYSLYLFGLVSRDWGIASLEPFEVLLVIGVGGVEGDEGVVGQAFDALCGVPCHGVIWKLLVHD